MENLANEKEIPGTFPKKYSGKKTDSHFEKDVWDPGKTRGFLNRLFQGKALEVGKGTIENKKDSVLLSYSSQESTGSLLPLELEKFFMAPGLLNVCSQVCQSSLILLLFADWGSFHLKGVLPQA